MSRLDDKGRCCGRKPIQYKGGSWRSPAFPHKFCDRCYRAFDSDTHEQMQNWAWMLSEGEWVRRNAVTGKPKTGETK